MTETYEEFLSRQYPTALEPGPHIADVIRLCNERQIHYLDGLFMAQGLDPESSQLSAAYLAYDILVQEGEMPPEEALVVIDNLVTGVLRMLQ